MVSNQEYEVCFVLRIIIKYENKKIFGTLYLAHTVLNMLSRGNLVILDVKVLPTMTCSCYILISICSADYLNISIHKRFLP